MSYAVKVAKANYRGDPGLFGKILGGIGKLIPGVSNVISAVEMAKTGVQMLAGNGKPKNPSVAKAFPTMPQVNVTNAGMFANPAPQGPGQIGLININRPQLPAMPMGPGNTTQGGFGGTQSTSAPCQSGYHRNKHGYYSQRYGWVPAGSVCVKNRKRNPLNPRAASRAMTRLTSARKATRAIQKFFGQTHRPGAAVAKKGPCGCKGRR